MHLFSAKQWIRACTLSIALCSSFVAHSAPVIEGKNGWLFAGWESLDTYKKEAVHRNLTLIAEVSQEMKRHHMDLVILVVPNKAVLYQEYLPDNMHVAPVVENAYGDVIQQLQQQHVTTFDNSAVLMRLKKTQQVFFRTDYHWTAFAAEAAAQATADTIKQQLTVPASSAAGDQLGEWSNARYYGDQATHFLSEKDRKRLGKEVYSVRKPVTNNAMSLLDDEPAHIEVVGNSFVQPYFGFPQKLSNTLNQPVALTWHSGDQSSWKTFLDAMQKSDLKERKIVVWQWNFDRLASDANAADSWTKDSLMTPEAWKKAVFSALNSLKN